MYLSRPIHNPKLDLQHQKLGKLGNLSDSNTRHVASHMEDLFNIIENPQLRRDLAGVAKPRGINILSLDGGGLKGLFTLIVLERILAEAQRLDGSCNSQRLPCEYFDLIGGTSTGGLLAIMLGRLQMDIPSCKDAYRRMSVSILSRSTDGIPLVNIVRNIGNAVLKSSIFSAAPLVQAVCDIVLKRITVQERDILDNAGMSARDVRLLSTEVQRTLCFVCAVCEGHHRAERIRSYQPRNGRQKDTSSYTIWEAARATSAAPVYFPAIEIQGHYYFDGGLAANNPLLEVVDEASSQFPGTDIDCIVSIGTGKGPHNEPLPPIWKQAYAMIGRLTTTEAQYEQFMTEERYESLRPVCSRFQEAEILGKIDLAASDQLDEIERIAEDYVSDPDVKRKIVACATRIVESRRT